MEKSAKHIGKRKWQTLSVRQQHTAIAWYAVECLTTGNLKKFQDFYSQVLSWSQLDRFEPPGWLSEYESLQNYFFFHQKLSGKPPHFFKKRMASATPKDTGSAKTLRDEGKDCSFYKRCQGNNKKNNNVTSLSWNPSYPITVALDQVLTPYNFGSILRVIDNFGFECVVHSTTHLNLSHPQLKRAARGTENWIPIKYEKDLPQFLHSSEHPVIGLELTETSIPVFEWHPPEAFILVLGNEAYGISEEIINCCNQLVHIPMLGYKHSMNLSHALAAAACYINLQ